MGFFQIIYALLQDKLLTIVDNNKKNENICTLGWPLAIGNFQNFKIFCSKTLVSKNHCFEG